MKLRNIILIGATVAATVATTAAEARRYYRHHSGYAAYARVYPAGRYHPTGPASTNFELGSGWNNGTQRPTQYGRPGHW